MKLTILTPQKRVKTGIDVEELFAPGIEGTLNILPQHAALVTELETGILRWKEGKTWVNAAISHGFMEVVNDTVTVLADALEIGGDIDQARAKEALERAKKQLTEGGLDDANFRKHELKLKRAMSRLEATQS